MGGRNAGNRAVGHGVGTKSLRRRGTPSTARNAPMSLSGSFSAGVSVHERRRRAVLCRSGRPYRHSTRRVGLWWMTNTDGNFDALGRRRASQLSGFLSLTMAHVVRSVGLVRLPSRGAGAQPRVRSPMPGRHASLRVGCPLRPAGSSRPLSVLTARLRA